MEKLYTAGEIAKLSKVSSRAIRFYDEKNLLKPVKYSESGYRYYNEKSLERLQQIIMLKYLGFSLEQISEILEKENKNTLKKSLEMQKEILLKKKKHICKLIEAVEVAERSEENNMWDNLVNILSLLAQEELISKQYETSCNLEKRINIHKYGTSKIEWFDWVFERINIREGMKILDVGCGNGMFWYNNALKLPNNITIYMTDFSQGMINSAMNTLSRYKDLFEEKNITFIFKQIDGNEFQLDEKDFNIIIANHMLYHVSKRQELLRKLHSLLIDEGRFFASTIGEKHMGELNDFVKEINPNIEILMNDIISCFSLENGEEQLKKVFSKIKKEKYICDLVVDNPKCIYDYVYSYPGNASEILENMKEEFLSEINEKINKEGAFYIHKSTGMFMAMK